MKSVGMTVVAVAIGGLWSQVQAASLQPATAAVAAQASFDGMLLAQATTAPAWKEGVTYTAGTIVSYNGALYVALVTHTAWAGTNWNPAATPTLWSPTGGTAPAPAPTPAPAP